MTGICYKQGEKVEINNMPSTSFNYIVARYNEDDAEWWYWGSFDDVSRADDVADIISGTVFRRDAE